MKNIICCLTLMSFFIGFSQITLLPFSPSISSNHFGSTLDAFGNEIVVTASNTMAMTQSKVFVFEAISGSINQQNYFTPSDGVPSDSFGHAVSINNDFIAVSSPFHDQIASNSGAVYMYRKIANNWQFIQKITAFDGLADDYFGYAVKVYNNQLFVTALDDEPAGQPTSSNNGSVYVYNFNGTNWVFLQKITIASSLKFGGKIEINNNRLVISSNSSFGSLHTYTFDGSNWNFSNSLNQALTDFNLSDNQLFILTENNMNIYDEVSNNWSISSTLTNLNYNDKIPTNFEIKNDLMFVCLNFHMLLYTDKTPVSFYKKIGGNWVFQQIFYGNGNSGTDDYFGSKIALTDSLAAFGAPNENYPLPYEKSLCS